MGEGTLYPALHRLEQRGWVTASWGPSGEQPAREVLLAHQDRPRALRVEAESWGGCAAAVFAALDAPAIE